MTKYAIRFRYEDEDIWFDEGKPMRFETMEQAIAALHEEMDECERAFKAGYMEDEGDFDCYDIVEVEA